MTPFDPSDAQDGASFESPTAEGRRTTQAVLQWFTELSGPMDQKRVELLLPRICEAAVAVLEVDAVGISVMLEGTMRMPLGASSPDAQRAEQAQFTLGEGPCLAAYTTGTPVLIPDVADPTSAAWATWPTYAAELLSKTPFKAVFALPLSSRGMSLGTISMYRTTVGPMSHDELGNALAVTNLIFDNLLASGTFSGQLQPEFRWLDLPAAKTRTIVWQAIGMATMELGLNPPDALALLRSYSYGHDRLMDDVAADVVAGSIQLEHMHP